MMMMMRWQSFVSCKAWGAKIEGPEDLMRFPWEVEQKSEIPTDEEIEEMREQLRRLNDTTAVPL